MHLYWRVIEELKYIGEIWEINDPAILRYYNLWVKKHSESINQKSSKTKKSNPLMTYRGLSHSLN
jgi:hypothetical protein